MKQFKLGGPSKLHSEKSLGGTSLCNVCVCVLTTVNRNTKSLAYMSLVCPILEYGAACWDPCTEGEISALDQVQ
jgi:hypothetical protein